MCNEHESGIQRRALLAGGAALFGTLALSSSQARGNLRVLLAPADETKTGGAQRTLVLLQLSGGNDGLSMVVPFADDGYQRARKATRIESQEVLRLDEYRGLHPELKRLRKQFGDGRVAIVEGCGYPDPIRSHFQSMEVWHAADARGRDAGTGWIGRLWNHAWKDATASELVVHLGATAPYSLYAPGRQTVTFQTPASYKWVAPDSGDRAAYEKASAESEGKQRTGGDAVLARLRGVLSEAQESSTRIRKAASRYKTAVEYPESELAQTLRVVAALSDARLGSRVVSVELGGFDSHNNQRQQHDTRMRELDAGLGAFLDDLAAQPWGRDVVVMAFSEFGRRVKENGSQGTDHGVAGPMFVAGPAVKGGLYGKHPSLSELDDGDLVHTTDFRSVYGTLIDRWFGSDHTKVLGAKYPQLGFLPA